MPNTHYTLFVDESGDQDLAKFRTKERQFGSDPFLVFGGVLVPTSFVPKYRQLLTEIMESLDVKALHCTDLSHLKRAYFAREAAKMRILLFGVISKKETIGEYQSQIEGVKVKEDYYNKCAGYLLERVAHFMTLHGYTSDQLSIVFERKNHDYERMRNFIRAIQKTPYDDRAKHLGRIDTLGITAEWKKDELLLSLADLTAFSIYQSVTATRSNFLIPEQRYLRELKSRFWKSEKDGQIANFGLKYIKGPFAMNLEGETLKFAMKFYKKSN